MKKDIEQRFLNLGSNIRAHILCVFLSSNLFKKERKLSKIVQTFVIMLEAKQINSSATLESSYIRVLKTGAFFGSSFNFKLIEMEK
jgi:hypothetical protein